MRPGCSVREGARAVITDILEGQGGVLAREPGHDAALFEHHVRINQLGLLLDMRLPSVPLRRMDGAEEMADPVLFLVFDESRCIIGAEVVIDGGATLRAGTIAPL